MLTMPSNVIETKAARLLAHLQALDDKRLEIQTFEAVSRAGGGSLPMLQLPSKCVGVQIAGVSANRIDAWLRAYHLPVIGRIEADYFMMDVRTVQERDLANITGAFGDLLKETST
jgi:L-seryl-tRNA(Ser) seleniumtransferase